MSARPITICLALLLAGAAQASGGIQLIGGCDTPGEAFDVAVSGNYAYVADGYAGLRVISVVDPTQPVEIGSFDTPGWARGVAVSGDYAYVADYDSGLQVVSVADPARPVQVGHYDAPGLARGVALSGDRAFVAAGVSGLRILSVADPALPTEVGHYDVTYNECAVAVSGDYAFIDDDRAGFLVVSVADPANPSIASGYFFDMAPPMAIAVSDDYAYVTVRARGLHVFSVDDSGRATHIGQCGGYARAWGVAASRGYAYVAADEDGLRVISLADPAHPTEVASYDAPNWWANGVTTAGDYVYVAYGMAGLQIFQALGGIEESPKPQAASCKLEPTIVRGVLFAAGARDEGQGTRDGLLDISGRKVLKLKSGANDVSYLAPGVYFVRSAVGGERSAVTKVIIAE